jgi:hypothetical protein
MRNINVVAKKMARNGLKIANSLGAMPVFCLTHFVLTYFGSDISAFHISALA